MRGLARYGLVWRIPGAPTILTVGIVARLGVGMTPLALLLLVEQTTGRYAAAGLVGGVYALVGAAFSPAVGRFADRVGPAPVLLVTAVAHPLALTLLLLTARRGSGPLWVMCVAAGAAGATYPPLSAAIRRAWNDLTAYGTGRHDLRATALAAETSLFELVFVVGPLLVAGFVIFAGPASAIIAAAVVTLVGTVVMARNPVLRDWQPHPGHVHTRGLGPLRAPGFAVLLACVAGLGTAFGAAGVAVPAYANTHGGGDALGGVLLGVWGLGSAIGGIWYGTRRPAMALSRQFAWWLGGVAGSFAVLAVMPSPVSFGLAAAVGGAAIAPALTVGNNLVGRIAPGSMLNEAYTWIVTVSVAASAAGGSVAGLIVDQPGGVPWGFLFAAAALTLATGVAALPNGPIARADSSATDRHQHTLATEPA